MIEAINYIFNRNYTKTARARTIIREEPILLTKCARVQQCKENFDERVTRMIAWALGRLGGEESKTALESSLESSSEKVREEILLALKNF